MRLINTIQAAIVIAFPPLATAQGPGTLFPSSRVDTAIGPGSIHQYGFRLQSGYSIDIIVTQRGVDLVVELRDSRDSLIQQVDSPNGRNGPEPLEFIAPKSGRYALSVRPFDADEPAGRYTLEVTAWRDSRATSVLLALRRLARDSAAAWLQSRSEPLPPPSLAARITTLPLLDSLAARVQVIGIGEATHGSREFGDTRLMLTRYLIEHHRYRLVAIEASASRLARLNRFTSGAIPGSDSISRIVESGWIGRRALRELVSWLRRWNADHPADPVRLMGLDPQDNQSALADLHAFLARAYPTAMDAFAPVEHELAVADSQTWVFGDSRVNGPARGFLESLVSHAEYDAPLLARLHDSALVRAGLAAATQLLQFSDFNAGTSDPWTHSRDWVMASNLLSAMAAQPEGRAIFWAHNAHIAAPDDRAPGGQPMGSWLRAALGCRYGALAVTFDHGDFVAQIPNDLEDDLAVNTLPPTPDEAIEGVLRTITKGPLLSTWNCEPKAMEVPAWLQTPRRMHWVGALFRPRTDPNTAFRTFRLLDDFDGIVFIPGVTADEMPTDRPLIPARRPE